MSEHAADTAQLDQQIASFRERINAHVETAVQRLIAGDTPEAAIARVDETLTDTLCPCCATFAYAVLIVDRAASELAP